MMSRYFTKKFFYAVLIVFLLLTGMVFVLLSNSSPTPPQHTYHNQYPDSTYVHKKSEFQMSSYMYRVAWGTLLILFVIFIGARFYRKYANLSNDGPKSNFRIISRKTIGPKQFLLLINVEGHKLLLGVSEQSINLISDFGIVEESMEDYETPQLPPSKFLTVLNRLRGDANA